MALVAHYAAYNCGSHANQSKLGALREIVHLFLVGLGFKLTDEVIPATIFPLDMTDIL